MTQICRYCDFLCINKKPYCSKTKRTMSEAEAKSPNRCHDFVFSIIDAFGEEDHKKEVRTTKTPSKTQCDGQMTLDI